MKKYINYSGLVLILAGIILSVYLWWYQVYGGEYAACTISGCSDVLKSEYGKMLGIPIAVYGAFYYVITGIFVFQKFFIQHKVVDYLLYASIIWGFIYSVYLRYLEFFKIGEICSWCWLSVLFILLLGIVYGYDYFINYRKKN
jgi:uncharacterized membrane protein